MSIKAHELRSFPFLQDISDADLGQMAFSLKEQSFSKSTSICREAVRGDTLYLLKEGEVEVSTILTNGQRIVLAQLGSGSIFGQNILVHKDTLSPNVRSLSKVKVFALARHVYHWALEQPEQWAIMIQREVCINFIRQMRKALSHMEQLADNEATLSASVVSTANLNDEEDDPTTDADGQFDLQQALKSEQNMYDENTIDQLVNLLKETETSLLAPKEDENSSES